jgi:hypothetical protein
MSFIIIADTITTTLGSRSSVLVPCDSSTRLLELLVLLDQHWTYQRLRYPICLLSRTGDEMLAFVRSMMEWLGGTVSKEDVGEEGTGKYPQKRKRDDGNDEDALGAFALRFKSVSKIFFHLREICGLIGKQPSGDHSKPTGFTTALFLERSQADSRCSCFAIPWSVTIPVLRFCGRAG